MVVVVKRDGAARHCVLSLARQELDAAELLSVRVENGRAPRGQAASRGGWAVASLAGSVA